MRHHTGPHLEEALGVEPTSLRALWLKAPYFTTGQAKTLTEVLEAFRYLDDEARHAPPPSTEDTARWRALTADEVTAVAAFMSLL